MWLSFMAQYLFVLFVDPATPQPFLSYLLSQLFGLSPRELELRKCIIGTPGCMAFCCYLIFPWKKKGERKRRECYTVYLLDSKILPPDGWTSLNWFLGYSGRETCKDQQGRKRIYWWQNPIIFNMICWLAGSMGETTHQTSVWCSKLFLL